MILKHLVVSMLTYILALSIGAIAYFLLSGSFIAVIVAVFAAWSFGMITARLFDQR